MKLTLKVLSDTICVCKLSVNKKIPMGRTRLMGLLAIFCTTVFLGLSFVSIKVMVAVIPPMTLAFL